MRFTQRQSEIADLAITSMSNKEIAARLNISCRTVELQLTRIYREAEIEGEVGSKKRVKLMNKIRNKK